METEFQILLYFYSTAPQVLGAMLAIIGALQISRIGTIKSQIEHHSENLQERINSFAPLQDFPMAATLHQKLDYFVKNFRAGSYNSALSHLVSFIEDNRDILHSDFAGRHIYSIESSVELLKQKIEYLKSLYKILSWVFWFNGIIVLFFLFGFIGMKYISDQNYLFPILLIAGLVLSSLSIYTILTFVVNSVKEKEQYNLFNMRIKKDKAIRH